jgi:prepilin-type N-terminal cleavage/methylation domain-containing protein
MNPVRIQLTFRHTRLRAQSQRGMTLIELMISMLILAVGMCALTLLLTMALKSDSRNNRDTTATLLAQMVIEQVSAQHPASNASISVTDCAGNAWTIATQGGASPNGTGANLVTSSSTFGYGGIDPTEAYASIPAGYAMHYVECSVNGSPTTYEVRWNVMTIDPNYTRLVTASARPVNATSTTIGNQLFAIPVTLRAIAAP